MRIAKIVCKKGEEIRKLLHIQFLGWADQGVPNKLNDVINIIRLMRASHNAATQKPTVIHCSAGIGRTGVLIGVDIGLEILHTKQKVNLASIVKQMREDRCSMVQTYEQLELIYRAFCKFGKEPKQLREVIGEPGMRPVSGVSKPQLITSAV